jgi:predicted nucleic acid-binding protein
VKRGRAKAYLLDTSAVLAFFEGEPGVAEVRGILGNARRRKCRAAVSLMSVYELLSITTQESSEEEALRRVLELRSLPIVELPLSQTVALRAAHLKASYPLSVADSWIAATAIEEGAILVHKDPEFEPLAAEVLLESLPDK